MTFTLTATHTLAALASAATSVTITVCGDEILTAGSTTTDSFKTLDQRQVPSSATVIYTVPASSQTVIKTIALANTTGAGVTVTLFVDGLVDANRVVRLVVPANGAAYWTSDGWQLLDASGVLLTTSTTTLTGDVTGTGTSAITTTLATVNAGVGSFGTATQVPAITVNAKGLVTAAANTAIQIAESQVTNLVTDLAGKQPTGNYLTALTADVTAAGPGSAAATLATVNANVGSFGSASSVMTQTVNAKGLTTAAASVPIAIANTAVSGLGSLATVSNLTGNVTSVGAATTIAPSAVTRAMQANAAANTITGEFTGTPAAPQDLALAANTFPARSSTGNVAAKTISDPGLAFVSAGTTAAETALLDAATTALKGLMSAVDKLKLDNAWLDVTTDFGANNLIKTTGTDQTTKITAVLAAAPAGSVLYWPAGTYDTQGGHSFGKLLIMRGATRSGSVINCTHATNTLFTLTAGADGSGFEQMRLSANTAALRTAGYALDMGAIPNTYMQQCDVLFHWGGVRSAGALQFLDDCNIREMGANAINGNSILITSTGDRYIRRVTMDQAARTVDFSGIRITQCSSVVIEACNIIHCGTALHVNATAGAGTAIASVYAVDTFFDTSVIGANITCATGSDTVQRVTFVRSWFSTHTTAGVQINHANVNSVSFIGCEFYQEPFGIDATACTEWDVRASRFAGCSTNAIRTAAGATHSFTISDNFIGNGAGFGANAQGINIQAGTYARYQVLDNRGLDTNTTAGIIDLGVVPVANQKNVANNMGCVLKGALQLSTSAGAAVTVGRGVATVGTAETLLFGARIPANGVSAGQTFKITVVAQATAACNVNFATKAGAAGTIADTSIDTHAATAMLINGYVTYECLATVVALGASGNVAGVGHQIHVGSVVGKVAAAEAIATAPTTAAWFLSVTALTSVAAAVTVRAVAIEAL